MKTKTAFLAAVAAIALTAQGAGLWDVSVADFPRAAGDGGDSARIMRLSKESGAWSLELGAKSLELRGASRGLGDSKRTTARG